MTAEEKVLLVDTIVGAARSQHILTLNDRPRKRHGFLSPNQVFSKSTGLDARVFV